MLAAHPKPRVVLAHYGLAFWNPSQQRLDALRRLLQRHPQLLIDTSLGSRRILTGGLAQISRHHEAIRANRNALERVTYYTPLAARWSRYWRKGMPASGVLHGLTLPNDVLVKVYRDNPTRWLDGAP